MSQWEINSDLCGAYQEHIHMSLVDPVWACKSIRGNMDGTRRGNEGE